MKTEILVLSAISGLCWTIVYIECVRLGIKHRTYAMPFWALALNITWELVQGVVGYEQSGLKGQTLVNVVWFCVDCGILYTYFKYGRRYFPKSLPSNYFVIWSVLALGVSLTLQILFLRHFGDPYAEQYTAFLQNLLMSVLFIVMFVQRKGLEGQSMTIAVNKMIGTLAPTIAYGAIKDSPFLLFIGLMIFVYDMIYIGLLWRAKHPKQ